METTQSNQQNGSTYRSISDNFKCEQTKFSNQNRVDSAIKKMKPCHCDNTGKSRGYYVKYSRATSEKDKCQGPLSCET